MERTARHGLGWEETTFTLVPTWTEEPSTTAIESVCREQLQISSGDRCAVAYYAAGLFNRVYLVNTGERTLVMRVTLPVCPRHKTRAEVTTLLWVRENTSIPVPQVFGFDDSNDNAIGFEWILMEYMRGTSARKRWRTMSMDQKEALAAQCAIFQFEVLGLKKPESAFKNIGTLVNRDAELNKSLKISESSTAPGELVSPEFFMGDHLEYDIPRGPFPSTYEWLSAVLKIILRHQKSVLENSEDEDDREEAEEILPVAQKLLGLVAKVFPPDANSPETTALHHHDLNLNNILVDAEGKITAVIDWECVSALPLWLFSEVPKFLDGEVREEEPQRDVYRDQSPEEKAAAAERRDHPDYLDDEGKDELYWLHRMDFETTQLRKVYGARLKELCPQWAEEDQLKSDFYQAVLQCDGIWVRKACRWAERLEKGEFVRFNDA